MTLLQKNPQLLFHMFHQLGTSFSMLLLFCRFTQKNILRVYPAANRVNSSNFCPTLAWNYGAQMVAQNMQAKLFHVLSFAK